MDYTTVSSIAETGDYEFISVGTKGSVGTLVSMELDLLSKNKENRQQRKDAKSCSKIRSETVSVLCDRRMALNSSASRRDSINGKKSGKQGFLPGEVGSPADSCRKKGEGLGLQKSSSVGRHRNSGEKAVKARKSVSDLDEERGGFVWINNPSMPVKKNRRQDLYSETPLMSAGLIGDFEDDVEIERNRRLKTGLSVVEVVDLKCKGLAGNNNNKLQEKNWGKMSAIANRVMKGLGFSRLKPEEPDDSFI